MMRKIIKNCIRCSHCGDVLVSEDSHDFKRCSCGAVAIDGGSEYLRRIFKYAEDDFTELSEHREWDANDKAEMD